MVRDTLAGYLRPRPIELYAKRRPTRPAIDLDVIVYQPGGEESFIDFAIPDLDMFVRDAERGELSLNGTTYQLTWLAPADSTRIRESLFESPGATTGRDDANGTGKEDPSRMAPENPPPRIEIHDERDRRIDPPEGVVYESGASLPDEPAGAAEPTADDTCVFCASPNWQWIITPRPHGPGDDLVWAPYLVSCETCHELCSQGRRDELRNRVEAATGPYWILPELDRLVERIIAERHR